MRPSETTLLWRRSSPWSSWPRIVGSLHMEELAIKRFVQLGETKSDDLKLPWNLREPIEAGP